MVEYSHILHRIFLLGFLFAPISIFSQINDDWRNYRDQNFLPHNYGADTYIITNANQLAQLAYLCNDGYDFTDYKFTITSPIDLFAHNWFPIGNEDTHFNGTLSALPDCPINGVIFTGSNSEDKGFISYLGISGNLINLTLTNASITATSASAHKTLNPIYYIFFTSILAGHNYGIINGCTVHGNIDVERFGGGIAGWNRGTITNCINYSTINGNNDLGGISSSNSGSIFESINHGNITANGYFGGIAGWCDNSSSIENCVNYGTLTGNSFAGGIAGGIENHSIIANCSTYSDISATDVSGGITGSSHLSTIINCANYASVYANNRIGGIVGSALESSIINCVNYANTYGNMLTGAIVGDYSRSSLIPDSTRIENCFWSIFNGINSLLNVTGNGNTFYRCYPFEAAPGTLPNGDSLFTTLSDYVSDNPMFGSIKLLPWTLTNSPDGYPYLHTNKKLVPDPSEFDKFPDPLGTYDAYLYPPPTYNDADNFQSPYGLLTVTVSKRGRLSARLITQSGRISFSGKDWLSHDTGETIIELSKAGWILHLTFKGDQLAGMAHSPINQQTYAIAGAHRRFGNRKDTTAQTLLLRYSSTYTAKISPPVTGSTSYSTAPLPAGSGYLTIRITRHSGLARIAGKLADGTPFSLSSTILAYNDNGHKITLPIFRPLYRRKGSLGALMRLQTSGSRNTISTDNIWAMRWENSNPNGHLIWSEVTGLDYNRTKAHFKADTYTLKAEPVNIWQEAISANWQELTDGIQTISGRNNKLLTLPKNNANATLRINYNHGIFRGTFNGTTSSKALRVKYCGVLLQDDDGSIVAGAGYATIPPTDPIARKLHLKLSLPVYLTR